MWQIRREFVEKARDIFEEGMTTVVTVVIYSQFEESMLALKMEGMSESEKEDADEDNDMSVEDHDDEDDRLDIVKLKLQKKREGFWLCDDNKDVNLRLAPVRTSYG